MKRACFEEGPQTANTQCPLFGLGRRCIHAPCGEEKTFSTRCAPGFRGQSTRKPAGPTVEGEVPPGAKRLFRHVEAAIADGHSPFCGGCFFCGAAWAILLRKNGFSPGFVKFLPKFKKVLASYTGVRCMILSRKKRPDTEEMLAGAAPVTFRVEKRTFHADGHARRGKYATLNIEN